jgi:peroxiredoxin
VLVVLRGYPGYQCPLCSRQVADLRKHAEEFRELGASVLLVYPGSADELQKRAKEFLEGEKLPEPLRLVIDPDYEFTVRYGLRWNAPAETAYPSAFVLDEDRTVKYRKVSQTHGDRADTEELLEAVRKL